MACAEAVSTNHATKTGRRRASQALAATPLQPSPPQDAAKAPLCRCLALCHMGLQAPARALELVELSERYSPRQVGLLNFHLKEPCFGRGAPLQLSRTELVSVTALLCV
jgi:hypothetical protein